MATQLFAIKQQAKILPAFRRGECGFGQERTITLKEKHIEFDTDRLKVKDWASILNNAAERHQLEDALQRMLTANITMYLPASMLFPGKHKSITDWVDELAKSAQVLSVKLADSSEFIGLVLLHRDNQAGAVPTCHIGYFLSVRHWGYGYASEMVNALVKSFESGTQTKLLAGVDISNGASARVLEKAGFTKVTADSSDTRLFYEILTKP